MTAPDLLTTAPYFFQPPSYTTPESQALVTAIPSREIYLQTLQPTLERLRAIPAQEWEAYDVASVLHEENKKTGLKSKVYMTVMRHALSGMKVRLFSFLPRRLFLKRKSVCEIADPNVMERDDVL